MPLSVLRRRPRLNQTVAALCPRGRIASKFSITFCLGFTTPYYDNAGSNRIIAKSALFLGVSLS